MKNRSYIAAFLILIGLVILFVSIQNVPSTFPSISASTPTPRPLTCDVYTMKSGDEYGLARDGSFAQAIGSDGGTTIWLQMNQVLIDFIKSLNDSISVFSYKEMYQGKGGKTTGNYYRILDNGTSPDIAVWWNWVGAPSPYQEIHPGVRNLVCIDRIANGYAYVVAAPKSSSYEQYRNIDWLIQSVWGNWNNNPQLWKMILVDPSSGFTLSGASDKSFRIDVKWLLSYVRTDTIPWRVSTTVTPTNTTTQTVVPTITPTPEFTSTPTQTLTPIPSATLVCEISTTESYIITICKK